MKRIAAVLLLVFAAALSFGQTNVDTLRAAYRVQLSAVNTPSGTPVTFPNDVGAVQAVTVEEIFNGVPATASVVFQGCMRGSTCTTLETYATVANSNRHPTITYAYDYFLITPTLTSVVVTQTVTSASITNATTAVLTVSSSAGYTGGSYIVVSGLLNTNNLPLNGTWVVASTGTGTITITGTGWTAHGASGTELGSAVQTNSTGTMTMNFTAIH